MGKYCVYCTEPLTGDVCGSCGQKNGEYRPSPHHLLPGTVLAGKYLVGRALGEGGFGITYIGRDLNLDFKVAIKEYFPSGLVNRSNLATAEVCAHLGEAQAIFEKGRGSFLQEARILAKFAGEPGIVGVRDFFTANNTAYIVMDYLEGMTLRDFLKANGVMSFDAVTRLLSPVFAALQQVHSQGLIHRDISPDNIMLLENGQVKLLDFGAARNVTGMDERSLSVMLRPGYAPEEQYRTKGRQGPWTDVYALCATIYYGITGQNPDDAMNRVFVDELKAPSELGARISRVQEAALLKGMAVLQKNRYQSVAELLTGFSGAVPASIPTPASVSVPDRDAALPKPAPLPEAPQKEPAPSPEPKVQASSVRKTRKSRKKPNILCLILAFLLSIVAIDLLSLGVFNIMGEKDLTVLLYSVVLAIPTVLVSLPFFRRAEKGVSYRVCLVLSILTGILLLARLGLMLLAGQNHSYYLTGVVLMAALFYFLMRYALVGKKARARMNLGCGIALGVLVFALTAYTVGTSLTSVTIGDKRVSRSETSLSISNDMITRKQLEKLLSLRKLEKLSISSCFLDDTALEYIGQLTSLTSLNLSGNGDITDISALSGLTGLTTLNVSSTSITDISVVENMPQLTWLTISDTGVTDLSAVASLTELRTLNVSGVTDADWATLVLPSGLTYFYGEDCGMDSLDFLSTVEALESLKVSGNQISDLSPLARFGFLSSIDLSFNEITDLTGICDVRELELSGNRISDLTPLGQCTSLVRLFLSSNSVDDLTPLSNCPRIYSLALDNNRISDISALSAMNLEQLNLENNQVSDLVPLSTSSSMKRLYISGNQVSDIGVLSGMPQLQDFQADHNRITDISPLESTLFPENCTYLHLAYNNISDLTPLKKFQKVEYVYLSGNPITDITPLTACQEICRLQLNETSVADISALGALANLRSLSLIRTPVTNFALSTMPQKSISFDVPYSENMDLDSLVAMKEKGCSFTIFDVPENMLRELSAYGSRLTVEQTELYLHPVEVVEEVLAGDAEIQEDTGTEAEETANG